MEGKEAAEIRGLVLSQDASNRTVCYSTQLGAAICVQLPSDVQISRGQWLIFTEFEYEANVYIVEKGAINIENDENVLLQNDEILIRTKAVCSGDDSHSTFTKNTAFAGDYGYVVAGHPEIENGIVYNVNLAVHSMDGPLYFKIHSVENSLNTDNEQLLLKLTEAENEKNRRATPDFLTAEDTGSGKISDNASDQYSQPQNNQDNADDFDDWENGGAEIDNTNNHRYMERPPTQYSSYTSSDDLREGYGFVTKMNSDDIWVVYLENNASTAARFNWRVVPGPQVKSGIPFLCLYRVLDDPDFDYDIVKVIEVCESSKNDVRVINKEVSCLVPFDLCDLDSNVIDSMDYGYLPFLKCERFGTVVLNDMVIDPRGQNVPAKDIVKRYRRDSRAKAMAGWCRFVKDFYPKSNFMENYKGIEMVEVYVWRVEEIVGEVSQYQHRQRTIQRENLGEDYQKIERDDFIEREKRIARERDRLNNQGRSDPGSHSSISGSQYSRAESSMNDYHTPHGSTYNRGASSSMSFHTANGHNSRYQEGAYHQPPTQQNYSGSYRSTPVNPLYDDKDARIAELEKKVSHAYRQMETLCSAIDPFLGHGEYRKKLKECSHEYTDHLVTTHDLCRNMVREYGRNKDRNISN